MKTNQEPIPVILCGGGSILIDSNQLFPGVTQVVYYPIHHFRDDYFSLRWYDPNILLFVMP